MGMWVAGTLTFRCVQDIASRHKMTVVTPGINMTEVLRIVKTLGPKYDQIIIAGYPPFVKDIIDEGENISLNWKKYNVKFLFAAESFGEEWRDYMHRKVGSRDDLKNSLNIYGTADSLILAHETPLSILIRRMAIKNLGLHKDIFLSEERVPVLAQFNPALRYFENTKGGLLFSAFSGIPLIRYNIGDDGRVIPHDQMKGILSNNGNDLDREILNNNIRNWKLPFVYILGRTDMTASLYGINVYPENIRDALDNKKIAKDVSGKFAMLTKNDEDFNQYLEVNVELKNKDFSKVKKLGLEEVLKNVIIATLSEKNKEFKELKRSIGKRADPHVHLWPFGHKEFFTPGVKQKWHKKA
jgi:phenylacetate-CoA ligase